MRKALSPRFTVGLGDDEPGAKGDEFEALVYGLAAISTTADMHTESRRWGAAIEALTRIVIPGGFPGAVVAAKVAQIRHADSTSHMVPDFTPVQQEEETREKHHAKRGTGEKGPTTEAGRQKAAAAASAKEAKAAKRAEQNRKKNEKKRMKARMKRAPDARASTGSRRHWWTDDGKQKQKRAEPPPDTRAEPTPPRRPPRVDVRATPEQRLEQALAQEELSFAELTRLFKNVLLHAAADNSTFTKRYRRLSAQFHPDKHRDGDQARHAEIFKALNNANACLVEELGY